MITIRMDYSGPFESESALKYISSCDEVTHDNKPLTAGSILPLPVRPFLFFFLVLGRSIGRIEKKKNRKKENGKKKNRKKEKKIQEVFEYEAWYPSIIAVEPGNNKTRTQKNMAEALVDVIVILTL